MLRTIQQAIVGHADGHTGIGGIEVLSGNPVQTYNKDTNEYEPDRTLVPCILNPYFSAGDSENIMVGEQTITSGEWYEGAPDSTLSNRITSETSGYEVGASGMPAYSLSVKKNVSSDEPLEIYCLFTITNAKTGTVERYEASTVLRTSVFDSANFSVKSDMPNSFVVNPLDVTAASDGSWNVEYNVQLYNGDEEVSDSNAVYWWQKKENNAWRSFSDDEQELYATVSGKTLTIDARMLDGMESYRALAAYYADGETAPSSPPDSTFQQTFTLKLDMPKTIKVVSAQVRGSKMNALLSTPVGYQCRIYYNRAEITGKDDFFRFTWKGKSAASGSSEITIGTGKSITFTPKNVGFTAGYAVSVWCEVETFDGYAFVTYDGDLVTYDSKAVIQKTYA